MNELHCIILTGLVDNLGLFMFCPAHWINEKVQSYIMYYNNYYLYKNLWIFFYIFYVQSDIM